MTLNIEGLRTSPTMPLGIHFGRVFEIPVAGGLTFNPGILFSAKGTDYKTDSADFSLSPIYIEVPVNVAYSIGSGSIRFLVFGGPYFALGVGGTKLESGHGLKDLRFGTGDNKDLKSFDLGFNFGIGVSVKKFQVSAQYGLGLTNVSSDTSGSSEMKNKVIGVTVSAWFTGN
jgi:hypothetical protein